MREIQGSSGYLDSKKLKSWKFELCLLPMLIGSGQPHLGKQELRCCVAAIGFTQICTCCVQNAEKHQKTHGSSLATGGEGQTWRGITTSRTCESLFLTSSRACREIFFRQWVIPSM